MSNTGFPSAIGLRQEFAMRHEKPRPGRATGQGSFSLRGDEQPGTGLRTNYIPGPTFVAAATTRKAAGLFHPTKTPGAGRGV